MAKEPTVWIDLLDDAHAAFAAGRTLPDVEPREFEKFEIVPTPVDFLAI